MKPRLFFVNTKNVKNHSPHDQAKTILAFLQAFRYVFSLSPLTK